PNRADHIDAHGTAVEHRGESGIRRWRRAVVDLHADAAADPVDPDAHHCSGVRELQLGPFLRRTCLFECRIGRHRLTSSRSL
ncbi:MAG: hypothetical protein ACHRXM_27025, partial [Isosphaerales bacterium]